MSRAERLIPKLRAMAKDPAVTVEERHASRMKLAELLRKHPELEAEPEPETPKPGQLPLPFPAYLDQLLQTGEQILQTGEELRDRLEDWLEDGEPY